MATILLGTNDVRTADWVNGGTAHWQKLQALATGVVTTIKFRVGTTAGSYLRLAIHSDNAGTVGDVLAQGTATPTTGTWEEVTGLNVAVTQGTYYWLGTVSDGSTLYVNTGGTRSYKTSWGNNAFTDDPTGLTPDAIIMSVYAEGTTGWANIKNIRIGTGLIATADLASIWFGTTEVAVADIAELGGVAV